MLRHLLESQPRRGRTRSAAFVSLLIHAAIVGTAVAATKTVVMPDDPTEPAIDIVYVTPVRSPEPPAPRPVTPQPAQPEPTPAPPTVPQIVAPTEVPTTISEPNPNATPIVEPTFLPTTPGGTPGGEPGAGDPNSMGSGTDPLWADEVEKTVRLIGRQREPRYPDMLRTQRVEGRVVVSYVVDSLGRVEPNSIKVVESAHALFEPAVRQAVLASRFRPAEWRGRTVRQLVQQAFVFTLAR